MTISTENRSTTPKLGNGVWTEITFTFKVFATSEIELIQTTDAGVDSTLTEGGGNDYTVALNADQNTNPGGTITLTSVSTSNYLYTATSSVQNLQPTNLTNLGGFLPATLNNTFDRLTILIQQVLNRVDRSIKIPLSDGTGLTVELPTKTVRAGKAIVCDDSGNITVSGDGWEDQASAAAASAAAAAASATAAETAETNAETAETNAETAETNAAASATAAAASAASAADTLASAPFRDVVFITNSDSPYAIDDTHTGKFISVDTSGGAVVINLPTIASSTLPHNVTIKKTTADANTVTVNRGGTDEIDGATSKVFSAVGGATFIADTYPTPDAWTTSAFGASAGDMKTDTFTDGGGFTAGSSTTVTLTEDPGSENNTWVFFDGVYQEKSEYSVSGTTVTFTSAIPSGVSSIDVVYGTTLSVGVPSDTSVTLAKIASSVYASQAEAEAGTETTKFMTPERTKQAIDALSPQVLLNYEYDDTSAVVDISSSNTIPIDGTTPTSSEGEQIHSYSYTPVSDSSTIIVKAGCIATAPSNNPDITIAIFQGTTCVAANGHHPQDTNRNTDLMAVGSFSSPGTSAITISVRVGPAASTSNVHINSTDGSTNIYGGAAKTFIEVTEIA